MNRADSFEIADHNDVLQVLPRHVKPCSDDLLLKVFHRTTGGGRSVLLSRRQAEGLHEWLSRWLAEGWDGVKKDAPKENG